MIKLGLVGWPVAQSKSPLLHSAALKAAGLVGDYNLYPVDPSNLGSLIEVLDRVRSGVLRGINVTIPYKQTVIEYVDELSDVAGSIGAVNTIYQRDNKLIGENTDAPGFLADLYKHIGNLSNRSATAIVIGAGGSARAVVWALAGVVDHIIIAARRIEEAQRLSKSLLGIETRRCELRPILLDADSLRSLPNPVNLIINTTPLGMHPDIESSPWPAEVAFPKDCFIYDLVYNPLETMLMIQAKNQGLGSANGIGMLVEQAALAFEIWTGQPARRDFMSSAVA